MMSFLRKSRELLSSNLKLIATMKKNSGMNNQSDEKYGVIVSNNTKLGHFLR